MQTSGKSLPSISWPGRSFTQEEQEAVQPVVLLAESFAYRLFAKHAPIGEKIFGVVSMVTYSILLGVPLIGTLIPVLKATKVLPADALRDE